MRYNSPIKQEIHKKGYTIKSFCDRVGIDRGTIYNISKKKCKTRAIIIECIADGLGIPYEKAIDLCNK